MFDKTEKLRQGGQKPLNNEILATLFYEPSTRTRLSFESAILKLGGSLISTENAKEFSSAIKGEALEDTIRVIDKYADIIVLRHFEEDTSQKAASVSQVPIISGGDGAGEHPTQALLDMYTIWKEHGTLQDLQITIAGDLKYGRTARSLCNVLSQFKNNKIIFVSSQGLEMKDDIKNNLREKGVEFEEKNDLNTTLQDSDIIYLTRTQKERFEQEEDINNSIQINDQSLEGLKKEARILHPLPHVEEINLSLEKEKSDERIAYFRQAENGLFVRMALIEYLLNY